MSPRVLLLVPLLLPLAACAETHTIRQLGHPEFEGVVGAETRFERVGVRQVGQLDAFPETADDEGDHRFMHTIWPSGTEEAVYLDVRAGQRPPTGLPLDSLSVAVYALDAQQAQAFALDGKLPNAEEPITAVTTDEKQDGVLGVLLKLPRAAIPAGTEKLAFPILVQFEDGWIHLLYYQTGIPAAIRELDPEELRQQQEGAPPPGGGGESPGGGSGAGEGEAGGGAAGAGGDESSGDAPAEGPSGTEGAEGTPPSDDASEGGAPR